MIGYPEASRALYLLYLRGWWRKLEMFGLTYEKHGATFEKFELKYGAGEPLDGSGAVMFLMIPGVQEAARRMIQKVGFMVYHSTNEFTDGEAQKIMRREKGKIEDGGGSLHVSRGFSHQSAVLVLTLPENLSPSIEGVSFKEVPDGKEK